MFVAASATAAAPAAPAAFSIGALAIGGSALLTRRLLGAKLLGRSTVVILMRDWVFAGGVVPPSDLVALSEAGIRAFLGPGTTIIDCAQTLLAGIRAPQT